MYEEYIERFQEKYNFVSITDTITLKSGYEVTVCLTPDQVTKFNSHIKEIDMMVKKAELYSAHKGHITLGMVPKTEVFGKGNILRIIGSPDTIEALFVQLFS